MKQTNIGMIGLGVMGSNLARNMVSKGFTVSARPGDRPTCCRRSATILVHTPTNELISRVERSSIRNGFRSMRN